VYARFVKKSVIVAAFAIAACQREAESAPAASQPFGIDADPYVVFSDQALSARIAEAREVARASDRQVLLDFLADWCTDCREVVRLMHEEPARTVLAERYVLVYVAVGRFDRHRALIEEHGIDRITSLVVLDPATGQRVAKTTLEPITGSDEGLTSAELAGWLDNPRDVVDQAVRTP
jgi:thiol:disulfide interchange protein